MKKQYLNIAGALILLVILVLWFLKASRLPVQGGYPVAAKTQSTILPTIQPNIAVPQTKSTPSAEERALPLEQKRERYLEKAREAGKSLNRPARFYAQILDQNNQPVEGVKVDCDLSSFGDIILPGLMPHNKQFQRISDKDGKFSVHDETGLALDVKLSPLKGYEFKDDGFLQVMLRDVGADRPAQTLSTSENPYVFRAFKKGQAEPLIHGGFAFYGCVPDGRSYIVNLKSNQMAEGATGGEFKITMQRPAGIMGKTNYDWSVQIEGVNDDLVESKEGFMCQAPDSGYQPSWAFAQHVGGQKYTRNVNPRFYLKARDGSVYARLEAVIISDYRDKSAVTISYWLNPSGSKNLEYDPERRINLR